jgi:pimeloyl-ACP methyl ester carboxylesterase
VRRLAQSLRDQLTAAIGPDRQVAIVAHSLGGLIARSFMQEFGGQARVGLLISLATPHHGTRVADNADGDGTDTFLSALYWDRFDGDTTEETTDWIRCLNGLQGTGCVADDASRAGTFGKLVAIGVERDADVDDDGVVPIQSALFDEARPTIRARYRGVCGTLVNSHQLVHEPGCSVEQEPASGRGLEEVLQVIRRELTTNTQLPTLHLQVNDTRFRPGQAISVTATLTPGLSPMTVDAYVLVRVPDGTVLSLSGNGFSASLVPIATALTPVSFTGDILRFSFAGSEPPGGYTWFAALTEAGTLNVIGDIDQDPFTFSP